MGRSAKAKSLASREQLRRRFRPAQVNILFIGEAPPASGRFFYQADSGLYRAMREAFIAGFPTLRDTDFLECFQVMGCYLVDLCAQPVDRLSTAARRQACLDGEAPLARTLRSLQPGTVVTAVRSIAENAKRAQHMAGWSGLHVEVPYPGRWHHHRAAFVRAMVPLLRKTYRREDIARMIHTIPTLKSQSC